MFFKVSQGDFPNKYVLQSLYIAFIVANSADPDEIYQTTKLTFLVSSTQSMHFPFSDKFNRVMPLGLKTTRPRDLISC